jgi:bifunctional oligoribonuclease and PAP phosphatase NrnA
VTENGHESLPYRPPLSLQQALTDVKRVVLTAHIDPDPDALGSAMGLAHILRREGWNTLTVCVGNVPSFAPTLAGFEDLVQFPARIEDAQGAEHVLRPDDALVVMDTPTASRMGAFYDVHREAIDDCRVVVFDHHITNDGYGSINFIDVSAAATAEVVCDVLDADGIEIDAASATCFMTALLADTQTFRTENTTVRSLRRGYNLAAAGAPIFPIAQMLFRTRPVASLRLWGAALHTMSMQDGVIWTAVTQKMLRENDATMEDAEGLVDFLLATKETQVAIVLKEAAPGETKVSMRTVPGVDATRIVGAFGGGGHQRAAGGTIMAAPSEAARQLLPLVLNEMNASAAAS